MRKRKACILRESLATKKEIKKILAKYGKFAINKIDMEKWTGELMLWRFSRKALRIPCPEDISASELWELKKYAENIPFSTNTISDIFHIFHAKQTKKVVGDGL